MATAAVAVSVVPPGKKFVPTRVEPAIRSLLEERLKDVTYNADTAGALSKELSREVQRKVRSLGFERYKFVSQVVISEARGQGLTVASRCLWDPEADNFVNVTVKTAALVCTAVVFACYWE